MDRRIFVLTFLGSCGFIATNRSHSFKFSPVKISQEEAQFRPLQLEPNTAYLAKPNSVFTLPEHPRHGDHVQVVIDQSSLSSPCVLEHATAKILGEREPLTLDSMAIIKLTFNIHSNNWRLS